MYLSNSNPHKLSALSIRLTAGFRLFSYFGYDEGVAGHIIPPASGNSFHIIYMN